MEKKDIITYVEKVIPDFCKAIKACKENQEKPKLLMHQDAFAADYQMEELVLLGFAVKYAGIYGVELIFHGTNGDTLDLPSRKLEKDEE